MDILLKTHYAIQIIEKTKIADHVCYQSADSMYFIMSAPNKEAIHMEQTALAYYLVDNGFTHTAFPIPNIYGTWITQFNNTYYMVTKVLTVNDQSQPSHGKLLGQFHQINASYTYEPQYISSYGSWKQLWIDKITMIEQIVFDEANKHLNNYYDIVIDSLPYIIGISENAIQYLNETYGEENYNESDQGTITFLRYKDQLLHPIIWVNDLAYDHPTRDIAEYIRHQLLYDDDIHHIHLFLDAYESIQPLSIFSWRLLYARLLYPIHFLDILEKGFQQTPSQEHYHTFNNIINKQPSYEDRLRNLFTSYERHQHHKEIPMIQWV